MSDTTKVRLGDKIGRLTIIEDLGCFIKNGTKRRRHYWKCLCECGNECISEDYSLKRGAVKSCGCLSNENLEKGRLKHKYNEYVIYGDIAFIKFTNCNEWFIIDSSDLQKVLSRTWYKNKYGYAVSDNNNLRIGLNRYIINAQIGNYADHINGYKNDYRKKNLRSATPQESAMNIGVRNDNTSGHKGVYIDKYGKYEAYINKDGNRIRLGRFDKFEDACKAREDAEIKYFGEWRRCA